MMFSQWKMWDNFAHTYGYDAPRNQMRYLLYNTPAFGDYIKMEQGFRDAQDYLDNRGIGWEDADRVGNLPGAGQALGSITNYIGGMARNYVSKNVLGLYQDDARPRPRPRIRGGISPEMAMDLQYMGLL